MAYERRNEGGSDRPRKPFTPRKRYGRRKVCRFCADKTAVINYKNVDVLKTFTSERGKIVPRRISGTCAQHQRKLTNAIKQARNIALLPYCSSHGD